jgi:hypothetical protein
MTSKNPKILILLKNQLDLPAVAALMSTGNFDKALQTESVLMLPQMASTN